jgi:hypothetical protein
VRRLSYRHTAYPSAWLAGIAGFAYSVCFVLTTRSVAPLGGLAAFFLLVGGILGASALIGLYERLQPAAGGYALWSLIFGVAAALAATLHGGYDLANAINPPSGTNAFPSEVDPRGLGTFGLAGIAVIGFAVLMLRDATFPRNLGYLGLISGVLLVVVYLGRLTILSPSNPLVLGPAAFEGFIVNPLWYVWLGFALRLEDRALGG